MIIDDSLIEAQVTCISLDKSNSIAEIHLLAADKEKRWHLLATGVDEFLMEDVGLYNLVDNIDIYGADDVGDRGFIENLYYLLARKQVADGDASKPFIWDRIELVRSEVLKFWVINPVYGGLIFILARKILLREFVGEQTARVGRE